MEFEVKSFNGEQARNYTDILAGLRMRIFRDFPYLYDGDIEYEKNYLERYFKSETSRIFLVFYGERIIGATTCIALAEEEDHIKKPFIEKGLDVEQYFYLGESVLERIYRGRGFGKLFFQYREQEALKYDHIKYSCFSAVVRPDDHPLKPGYYKPLDGFWEKMDYEYTPDLFTIMSWKDVDDKQESDKKLEFWIKSLR